MQKDIFLDLKVVMFPMDNVFYFRQINAIGG